MSFRRFAGAAALAGAVAFAGALPSQAATLDDVRADDRLRCGINPGLPGFSHTDDTGRWSGFEAAYCRALAAAVLGDMLGLDPRWAVRAIAAEGNYAEIFEKNLGAGGPLGLPRGLSALYRDGGILYSAPFR